MNSKVKEYVSFIVVFVVGIGAMMSFYVFYTKQKELAKEQKEFLLALDETKLEAIEFRYLILQNFIYAYNNNDAINRKMECLQKAYDKLSSNELLAKRKYAPLKKEMGLLEKEIASLFSKTQHYLMYNASVKNSLLFLTDYEFRLLKIKEKHLLLEFLPKVVKTTQSLLYAKRLDDIEYLSKEGYLFRNDPTYSKELQDFIKTYNLHVNYVVKNLPVLLSIKQELDENKVCAITKRIAEKFARLYVEDEELLNGYAAIFFFTFVFTFVYLIVILVRYKKEHTKLVDTTNILRHSLTHDLLTGLKNRVALEKDTMLLQTPGVVLMNIDRFKDINDIFGGKTGDRLLRIVAKLIEKIASTQKGVVEVYRIGADEFVVLYDGIDDCGLVEYAKIFEKQINYRDFEDLQEEVEISVSIAVNSKPPLLENADLALKSIKRTKKRKIIVYEDALGLHTQAQNNIDVIHLVKQAVKEDRIEPFFQPIINLKTMQIEKFEALVRIVEEDEVISPFLFLDVAKKTHLYHDITRIVVEKTFKAAAAHPSYHFSINLSVSDILDEELVEEIFDLYEHHSIIADRIDIELLESEELHTMDAIKRFIERVHSFGSLVYIDDFGSGYSNFAYFADLEIDVLKVDGSIVKEVAQDKRKRHMLESIVMFAKNMNLKTVAEFVENEEILEIVKELGIDFAQGYHFSPPTRI